jgi:ribonuclease P protein component
VSERYQRVNRIIKADDFSSAFRLRPKKRSAHFTLHIRKNANLHARLGLVVAKRFAPRAITRNTIKRICKEVFRKAKLPEMDYIVRLTGPVSTRDVPATNKRLKQQLKSELTELFSQ